MLFEFGELEEFNKELGEIFKLKKLEAEEHEEEIMGFLKDKFEINASEDSTLAALEMGQVPHVSKEEMLERKDPVALIQEVTKLSEE